MISIIIPVFNAERDLRRMLDSILAQTCTDFECILIDDGSRDKSLEICREYEKQDRRFFCFSQENGGVSKARNRGLGLARGDYIAFLDADDRIPENYLAELLCACEKADIAVCDTVMIEDGKEKLRFTHENALLTQTQALNFLLCRKIINSGPCSKLFRKGAIQGLLFPPLKAYEDILFVLDSFCRAKKIAVTNKTAYHYIQNSTGAMSSMIKDPSTDIIVATEQILRFIGSRKDLSPECCYTTASHLFQYALPLLKKQNYIESDFIRMSRKLLFQYERMLVSCPAFPPKEKAVFILFANGYVLKDGKRLCRIRKEKKNV